MTKPAHTFDLRRLCRVLIWSLGEEREFCIKATAAIAFAVTLLSLPFTMVSGTAVSVTGAVTMAGVPTVTDITNLALGTLILGSYWVMMSVGACLMFRNLQSKKQRIAYLTLPASNAEKFVARLVLVFGGGILMIAAGTLTADVLRTLIAIISTGKTPELLGAMLWKSVCILTNGIPAFADSRAIADTASAMDRTVLTACSSGYVMSLISKGQLWALLISVVQPMLDFSLFAFCGVYFRRAPWAWGFLAYVAVGIAFRPIPEDMAWLQCLIAAVGAVAMWAATYHVFLRMQVITDKATNA